MLGFYLTNTVSMRTLLYGRPDTKHDDIQNNDTQDNNKKSQPSA
jgi:hypothetical protein